MKISEANQEIRKLPISLRDMVIQSRDNMLCAVTGNFELDIVKLDELMSNKDNMYNPDMCKYKGNDMSMIEYIEIKFGKESLKIINQILK